MAAVGRSWKRSLLYLCSCGQQMSGLTSILGVQVSMGLALEQRGAGSRYGLLLEQSLEAAFYF